MYERVATANSNRVDGINEVFCNLQPKCGVVEKECKTLDVAREEAGVREVKNLLDIITKEGSETKDQIQEQLRKDIIMHTERLPIIHRIHKNKCAAAGKLMYKIGLSANITDIVVSPYEELKQRILGITDFVYRMDLLDKFIKQYTRGPIETNDETYLWRYCIDTNVELLPSFYADIIEGFQQSKDMTFVLDNICRERGTISEDGDKWVDKYSGYPIRMIELDSDEGFDESGYRLTTKEVLEDDIQEKMTEQLLQTYSGEDEDELDIKVLKSSNMPSKKPFVTELGKTIVNIVQTLSSHTGIKTERFLGELVSHVEKHTNGMTGKKKDHEEARAQGKTKLTYETRRNKNAILLSGLYLLVYAQTAIPSIRVQKSFPGCSKSFSGFPISSDETQVGGLHYIACIIKKVATKSAPWNSIRKVREETIVKDMIKRYNTDHIQKDELLVKLVDAKREYLSNPENMAKELQSIYDPSEKWETFLPLINQEISFAPREVSSDLRKELHEAIKRGKRTQNEILNMIHGKFRQYSFYLQKMLNVIAREEDPYLQTKSGIPFLENACCHAESVKQSAIDYFANKNHEIRDYNKVANSLSNTIDRIKEVSNAALLFDKSDSKLAFPSIDIRFNETTIYKAFIQYCNFNSGRPLAEELRTVCTTNSSAFNDTHSIEEKIKILKSEGQEYSADALAQLMRIIQGKLVSHINEIIDIEYVQHKLDVKSLLSEEIEASSYVNENIRKCLDALKETTEGRSIQTIRDQIVKIRAEGKTALNEFMRDKSNKKTRETFFKQLDAILTKNKMNDTEYIHYLQRAIYLINVYYPALIVQPGNIEKKMRKNYIHNRISKKHKEDLVSMKTRNKDTIQKINSYEIVRFFNKNLEKMYDISKLSKQINPREDIKSFNSKIVIDILSTLVYESFINLIKLIDAEASVAQEENPDNISSSSIRGIKQNISMYMIFIVKELMNEKSIAGLEEGDVKERMQRYKDKEKNLVRQTLRDMPEEARRVDNEFKKLRLGRWNKGLQKGLTKYDAETYDDERNEGIVNVREQMIGVDNYEAEEAKVREAQIEEEEYDLSELFGENDDELDDESYDEY